MADYQSADLIIAAACEKQMIRKLRRIWKLDASWIARRSASSRSSRRSPCCAYG